MPGAIDGSRHIHNHGQLQRAAESETLERQIGAGVVGIPNTFSYYQSAVQAPVGDSRITPLPQPQPGSANILGTMDVNDLLAQLNGLRLESDQRARDVQDQASLASRDAQQTQRDKRIKDLESQLNPADSDKKDKCATAKIVIGALLLPAGAPLLASGILDKKAVQATEKAHNQMLQFHFGTGHSEVASFEKEYAKDHKGASLGWPIDQEKHQVKLNELKDKGIVDTDLHADLSRLIANEASPAAIHDRVLKGAIAGYVDLVPPDKVDTVLGKEGHRKASNKITADDIRSVKRDLAAARVSNDGGMSYKEILALMAQQEQQEEMEKVLREVQENIQGVPGEVISAAKSQWGQMAQRQNNI